MKLTDARFRALKPTDKVQKISDGGGLYIHVGNVQNFSHIEWLNRLDASLSRVRRKFSC